MSLSPYFTDVAATRTRGGLSTNEGTGAATVAQIDAAIALARREMKRVVGITVYNTVAALTESDFSDPVTGADDQAKYEAFDNAESYFALSFLPEILGNQQFAAIGHLKLTQVDKNTVQSFASLEEGQAVGKVWADKAYRELRPYLAATDVTSDGDEPDGISSEDGEFHFMAV